VAAPLQPVAAPLQPVGAPLQPVAAPQVVAQPAATPPAAQGWRRWFWGERTPAAAQPAAAVAPAAPTAQQLAEAKKAARLQQERNQRSRDLAAAAAAYDALPARELQIQAGEDDKLRGLRQEASDATSLVQNIQAGIKSATDDERRAAINKAQELGERVVDLEAIIAKDRDERAKLRAQQVAAQPPKKGLFGWWGGRKTGRKRRSIRSRISRSSRR